MRKESIVFVLLLLLLLNACSFGQNTDNLLLSCASNYFYKETRSIVSYLKDSSSEYIKSKTECVKKVSLPFHYYDLFLFQFKGLEPNWSIFVYHNKLKNEIGILDTIKEKGNTYPLYSSLLKIMNIIIVDEPVIDKNNIFDFAKSLLFIGFPIDNGIVILDGWKGIKLRDKEIIPDTIKSQIVEPALNEQPGKLSVLFFCWDRFDGILYKMEITYVNNELKVQSQRVGEYGEKAILI
jgi:hypothetical protein